MNSSILTIAIPTFNRNKILLSKLEYLLPQLNEKCKLLIIDNNSEVEVQTTLVSTVKKYPYVNIEIIRNTTNIGGCGNVLRCIEMCNTEWIWILGDDDTTKPDAVKIIFETIENYSNCLFLNFYSNVDKFARAETIVTEGISEFVKELDSFSNLLFLSTGIYKTTYLKKNLKIGYLFSYSLAPHTAMLLYSLNNGGKSVCMSKEQIVTWEKEAEGSSLLNVVLSLPILFELPLNSSDRKNLAQKVLGLFNYTISRWGIFKEMLLTAHHSKDYDSYKYLYMQLCSRMNYFESKIQRKIEIFVYKNLFSAPKISVTLLNIVCRLVKGKPLSSNLTKDRFARV